MRSTRRSRDALDAATMHAVSASVLGIRTLCVVATRRAAGSRRASCGKRPQQQNCGDTPDATPIGATEHPTVLAPTYFDVKLNAAPPLSPAP